MASSFGGFRREDFEGIAGTTWRGRDGFGGHVTQLLNRDEREDRFQSWALYGRQEIHIAYERDYKKREPIHSAKLFVYTSGERLAYGMYVECDPDNAARWVHWQKLRDDPEAHERLRQLLRTTDLKVARFAEAEEEDERRNHDPVWGFRSNSGNLLYKEDAREDDRTERPVKFEDLVREIRDLPVTKWVDLHIFSEMEQGRAISLKGAVAKEVYKVLNALIPAYRKLLEK